MDITKSKILFCLTRNSCYVLLIIVTESFEKQRRSSNRKQITKPEMGNVRKANKDTGIVFVCFTTFLIARWCSLVILKISVSSFNHLFSLIKHFDIWIDLKMCILLSPDRKCFLWRCGLNTSFDLSLMSSSVYEQGGHYKHIHILLYIYFAEAWSPYCYRKELNFWIRQVNLKSNLSASNTCSLQRLHHLTLTCQAFKSDIFFCLT